MIITLIIITIFVIVLLLFQIVKIGAMSDWRIAKSKCKDCKYLDKIYSKQREVICLKHGWRITEEMMGCKDKE